MAKKAPSFHSVFKERLVIAVRAPDGDSQRATSLRKLVAEMNERHATGHLNEWLIEALLDRVMRSEAGSEMPVAATERPTPAISSFKRDGGSEAAAAQRGEGRQAEASSVEQSPPAAEVLQDDVALVPQGASVRLGSGLRVM